MLKYFQMSCLPITSMRQQIRLTKLLSQLVNKFYYQSHLEERQHICVILGSYFSEEILSKSDIAGSLRTLSWSESDALLSFDILD